MDLKSLVERAETICSTPFPYDTRKAIQRITSLAFTHFSIIHGQDSSIRIFATEHVPTLETIEMPESCNAWRLALQLSDFVLRPECRLPLKGRRPEDYPEPQKVSDTIRGWKIKKATVDGRIVVIAVACWIPVLMPEETAKPVTI